jgi:branched-chain amino acid transport system permease protein
MNELAAVLIGGVTIGGGYVILAIGLSVLFGVSDVFNLAYGSMVMLAAYIAWVLSTTVLTGLSYPLVFLIVPSIMFGVGLAVEWGMVRVLRRKENWHVTVIIATVGLALIINNLILHFAGPFQKALPPLGGGVITVGGFVVEQHRVIMLAIAAALVVALVLFFKNTRLGMSMRAVAQDMVGGDIVGIPRNRVFAYTFALSSALAAVSGILLGSIYMLAPERGWVLFIKAFVIVILGGAGSLIGAVIAAFTLGIIESLISWQLGSIWVMPFWVVALLIILAIRPRGFFGNR